MKAINLAVLALLGRVSATQLKSIADSGFFNSDIDDGGMDDTTLLEISEVMQSYDGVQLHKKNSHRKNRQEVDDIINAL